MALGPMKGCERIHAAFRGKRADAVPCAPMLIRFAAAYSGVSLYDYLTDGHRFAECQIRVAETFDLDGIMCASEPTRVVHTLGGTVLFPEDGVPHVEKPAVSGPADLQRLSVPDPTDRSTRMGDLLIAVEALSNHFRGERSVFGWADAPFAEACNLMTTSVMLMTIMDDPPFAHALLEFCTRVVCAFLEAQLVLGVDAVGIGDAAASLISPEMYDEFAFPYERRVIDAVHRRGVPVKLHMCGNATAKLPRIVTTGIDILNVDQMTDIHLARQLAPYLCLKGNLDPVGTIYRASPEDVYAAGQQLIRDVGPRRYILSAGCEVPPDIAPENLKALVACAHDHEVTA